MEKEDAEAVGETRTYLENLRRKVDSIMEARTGSAGASSQGARVAAEHHDDEDEDPSLRIPSPEELAEANVATTGLSSLATQARIIAASKEAESSGVAQIDKATVTLDDLASCVLPGGQETLNQYLQQDPEGMPRLEREPLAKKVEEHVVEGDEETPEPPGPPTDTFASEVPTYAAGGAWPAVSTVGSEDPTVPGGLVGPSLSTVGSEAPLLPGPLVGSSSDPYVPESSGAQGLGAQAEAVIGRPGPSGGSLTSAGLLGSRYSDSVPPGGTAMLGEERGGGRTSAAQLEEIAGELEQQDVEMDVDEDLSPKDATSKSMAKALNKIGPRFGGAAEGAARRALSLTSRSSRVDPVSAWHNLTSQHDQAGEALPIFPPDVMARLLRQTPEMGAASSYSQAVSGGRTSAAAAAAVPVGGSRTPADVEVKEEEEDDEPRWISRSLRGVLPLGLPHTRRST